MKPTVLFVDDDRNVLDGLRRMLRDHRNEWEMIFVDAAREAIDRLQSTRVDAIVSDVQMPRMDGFQLLQHIRDDEHSKDIPVIIVTGLDDRACKRRALDFGATDLLNKPVDADDLLARLRNALRLKAYQDELKRQNAILEEKVAQRTAELADSRLEIIWRLGKAAEYRDQDTGNHVVRVGCYSRAIAQQMGLSDDYAQLLFLASPLHDIGKIGVPDSILLKKGALTPSEWAIMKRHCQMGAEILKQDSALMLAFRARNRDRPQQPALGPDRNPFISMAAEIALTHHEKWDGSGYPAGISGDDIPLCSRIVALGDVFDALCSSRSYKPAQHMELVLEQIHDQVGRHFDPEVYDGFTRATDDFRAIMLELADTPPAGEMQERVA